MAKTSAKGTPGSDRGHQHIALAFAFQQSAREFADRIAVQEGSETLRYDALASQVDRGASVLAARLGTVSGRNAGPGGRSPAGGSAAVSIPPVVAILTAHGSPSLIAFLAALQAGCIAAVLAPGGSESLLRRSLAHAGVDLLVYDADTRELAKRAAGDIACVGIEELTDPKSRRVDPGQQAAGGKNPALLIFTSGSTGEPRGVLHSHESILRNVRYHGESLEIDDSDVAVWTASLGTISGITDSLRILLRGGTLCPLDLREVPPDRLPGWLRTSGATIGHLVPTVFRRMVRHARVGDFDALRLLHLGGEPVTRRDFELFREHFPSACRMLNNLGCSEVPSFRQSLLGHHDSWGGSLVPLRNSVPGKRVILLDDHGEEIPSDSEEPGEIAVDTPFAALGYWRDSEETARAFTSQPHGSVRFRTGDIGRWQPDDVLVHLGRSDRSLKIAGRWVDLSVVEAVFQGIPAVKEAAVTATTTERGVELSAFCVAADQIDGEHLRAKAAQRLESWQVPGRIVMRDALPTLDNGKLDRRALERRAERNPAAKKPPHHRRRPRTDTEKTLIPLWRRVLPEGVAIRPESLFVELGGDSLAATELIYRIETEFAVQLPRELVFETRDLAELAEAIDSPQRHGSAGEYLYWNKRRGSGSPVLCIGSEEPMRWLVKGGFSVAHLRLDGLQTRLFRRLTISEQAQAFESDLRRAGLERPLGMVGFSYGGLVALALAEEFQRNGWERLPLLLLEPSVPGHPAAVAGGITLRGLIRVCLDRMLGLFRSALRWRAFRGHLWRNVAGFEAATFHGPATLVATRRYLDRWESTWRSILPGVDVRAMDASEHLSLVEAEAADQWLRVVEGWPGGADHRGDPQA